MADAERRFDDAPALKPEMLDRGPDALDDRFAGVVSIKRRRPEGVPFLGSQQLGERLALLTPDVGVSGACSGVEDGLRKGAPADIADEGGLLLRRRLTAFLCKGLGNADRGDIRRNFLLWRSRADGVLGQDTKILPRPLSPAGLRGLYSFT